MWGENPRPGGGQQAAATATPSTTSARENTQRRSTQRGCSERSNDGRAGVASSADGSRTSGSTAAGPGAGTRGGRETRGAPAVAPAVARAGAAPRASGRPRRGRPPAGRRPAACRARLQNDQARLQHHQAVVQLDGRRVGLSARLADRHHGIRADREVGEPADPPGGLLEERAWFPGASSHVASRSSRPCARAGQGKALAFSELRSLLGCAEPGARGSTVLHAQAPGHTA